MPAAVDGTAGGALLRAVLPEAASPAVLHPYSVEVLASNGCFSRAAAAEAFDYAPRPLEESLRDMAAWIRQTNATA